MVRSHCGWPCSNLRCFAVDGCKLPSNASKGWSGTRDDFKKKCTKLEAAIERIVKRHRESDLTQAQESVKETEEQCIATLTKQVKKIKDWLDDNDDTPDRIRKWHFDITQTPKQRGGEGLQPNSFCKKTSSITYISGSTANRALALLSTVFNQMRSNAPNPCKGVKKFPEKSRTRFLQPEELKRFFKALDAPETPEIIRDYLYLSLFTGGRRSNVLSMQWREIDFRSRLWHIPPDKIVNISKKK